jgi:hypothetical protein
MLLAAALVAAAVSSLPARAAIFEVTYTGRVAPEDDYQFDANGIFGPTSNMIFGSFTAVFRFDNSLGSRSTISAYGGDVLLGGSLFSAVVNPLLSATLSINSGPAVSFDGSYDTIVNTNYVVDHGYQVDAKGVTGAFVTSELVLYVQSASHLFGLVDTPFSYTVQPGDVSAGYFELLDQFGNLRAHGDLFPTAISVTVSDVSQTPVPGSLPLFASGVATLGFAMRRMRRRKRNATA